MGEVDFDKKVKEAAIEVSFYNAAEGGNYRKDTEARIAANKAFTELLDSISEVERAKVLTSLRRSGYLV